MARFSSLHLFIARFDKLIFYHRSMAIQWERDCPWFKDSKPSRNPFESIYIECKLSNGFPCSIRKIVVWSLQSGGHKFGWRKQGDNSSCKIYIEDVCSQIMLFSFSSNASTKVTPEPFWGWSFDALWVKRLKCAKFKDPETAHILKDAKKRNSDSLKEGPKR